MKKIELLTLLAENGAVGEKTRITMRGLGDELGISPQSAMRLLDEMEKEGLVEKTVEGKKTYVEITPNGLAFLEELCGRVFSAIHNGTMVGEVISGIGEGAYYVRKYAPIIRGYLGFEPYPGTLNVKVLFPRTIFDAFYNVQPVILPGFVRNGRTFGDVKAYRVRIDGIEGAVVIPSRTIHPPKIAEVVAPVYLREALGLADGSRITLKVVRG
ncbi:CTP-dependent riboflavin kinase [Thermococcus sp.]|uniref:CTP-dependent riboflavin kinase n=1 Tax=Thermococcus sp. TaxID=35749 RepID=UPI00260E0C8A|nr:CTP-dependent riboflavin kinase [Thermococcus sp.]